ncbi:hypothetical protein FH972_019691 [Carpinus fangiana]|uniref:Uncharacterized protein n=1 Tax=Carpinus fangiana TaxID=176857 RepID=A0A5N6RVA2_9ROSI|nr:hypothetical protein FH972_019691 [Carpinus fangiana]
MLPPGWDFFFFFFFGQPRCRVVDGRSLAPLSTGSPYRAAAALSAGVPGSPYAANAAAVG